MGGGTGWEPQLWLRLRALDGLLRRDLRNALFQHTIRFFQRLRLESTSCTALSALDVVSQGHPALVLCADSSLVLAQRARFVTQAGKLRQRRCRTRTFDSRSDPARRVGPDGLRSAASAAGLIERFKADVADTRSM